jgi:hypothetical protein
MGEAVALIVAATPPLTFSLLYLLAREAIRRASETGGEAVIERKPWRIYLKVTFRPKQRPPSPRHGASGPPPERSLPADDQESPEDRRKRSDGDATGGDEEGD